MYFRCLFIGLTFSFVSASQTTTQLLNSDGKMKGAINDINGAIVPTFNATDIAGNRYLGEEWNNGSVLFKKGKIADSLLLQFDLVTNNVYFKRENVMQAFLEEVEMFRFYPSADLTANNLVFRSGYPAYGQQEPKTFYQVLEEGENFHLLKLCAKKISEAYVYNAPAERSYIAANSFFVFDVKTGELYKINPGKKAVSKLLPAHAATIESLCKNNNWDLKTETELADLFKELNRSKTN
jgi:hypothetical protein